MDFEQVYDNYCRVILHGLNVQKGQCLQITAEPCSADLLHRMARHAYQMGVKYVEIQMSSSALLRERLLHSADEALDYTPRTITAKQDVWIEENWARLVVSSPEDPDALRDIPQERNIKVQTAMRKAQEKYKQAVITDKFNWNVCALPTEKWAGKVLKRKASARTEQALWRVLVPIYRLAHADPVQAWKEHCATLSRRSANLNALRIKELRFRSSHTDLTVGLHEKARWKGGYSTSSTGVRFIPNLPTEEVFTTPHFAATEGHVRLTRPAIIFEKEVIGAEVTFSNGKVTSIRAQKNEQVLKDLVAIDEGAAQIGEIALVDSASPIFQSKRIFYNILFDENAACHFAFGSAYPSCVEGGVQMSKDEQKAHGINQSIVHNDVMIGSEEVEVTALTYSGARHTIIKNGLFQGDLAG